MITRHKIIWIIIGTIFLFFSNGLWTIPIAIWIVLICFYRFSTYNNFWIGLVSILLTSFVCNVFIWKGIIPLPSPIYYIVSFMGAVFFTLPFSLTRLFNSIKDRFYYTLIFPSLYTLFSFAYTQISPSSTYGSIAYTQSNIILKQIVSVTGIWGIIFILGWTASVVNYLIDNYDKKLKFKRALLISVSTFLILLIFGIQRVYINKQDNTLACAGILNEFNFNKNISENLDEFILASQENEDSLFAKTEKCINSGTKLVLWQETAHMILDSLENGLIDRFKNLAKSNDVFIGLSVFSLSKNFPSELAENKIIWITPTETDNFEYLKAFPTPAEIVKRGDLKPPIMKFKGCRFSTAICFDMNFYNYIRSYSKYDLNLLCVPANDWKEITPYHATISSFRAIENGFSVFRVTGNGLSVAYDYKGRELNCLDSFQSDKDVFFVEIPLLSKHTIYSAFGDVLVWISGIIILIIIITIINRKK
jgi:apolipoprotein N-acyltransferase